MATTSDAIVIGGGIAGVGAAAFLSDDAKVTVLEAEPRIGHHATGRSAAVFIRNYGNQVIRALNAASEPFLSNPEAIGEQSLLTPRGELLVAPPEDVDALAHYLAEATGMRRITPAEAVALVPILREDLIVEAAYEPSARDIDVDRLLQGLARKLRANGGGVATGMPVRGIERTAGVWRVTAPAGTFEAPLLVNAAGAWADEVARMAGVGAIGLRPLRRSVAVLPAPAGYNVTRWPLVANAGERWYAKPMAGKLMVSPADEDPVDPHDAWADDMVLAEGLYRFEQAVTTPVSRVESSWAGLRSFVADRTPVVGFAPDGEGFLWLAAQGGYGVQTAPALCRLAADLGLGRPAALPSDVVRGLSPARLAA